MFQEIFSACLALEKGVRIAYLGPEGTFSHMAVKQQFGLSARATPIGTIPGVFEEVERGDADFGVVPVENTTEGGIIHTFDTFLESDLKISAEIALEIHMCLLARAGVALTEIERVYSIPVAAGQCRRWLATHLPRASIVEARSTADGARLAHDDARGAAVGAEIAARLYDLVILRRNIEDLPHNMTRFLVVGREQADRDRPGQDVAAAGDARRARHPLPRAGRVRPARPQHEQDREPPVAAPPLGVRVLRRHRRPRSATQPVAAALADLRAACETLKVLGSYPRADDPAARRRPRRNRKRSRGERQAAERAADSRRPHGIS